jgi:NADH dehydrogenase FAD-containing subunit
VSEKVKESQTVLCVGAGPTGLETAGYIKETYPEKRVAVCLRGEKLMPSYFKAHNVVEKVLKQADIEILYNTPYSEDSTLNSEFQLVLDCRGFKYSAPYMTG